MKCVTMLIIADIIKSFKKCHPIKKAVIDGIVIIIAIIVPFKNSSFVGNLEFYSFNTENMKLIIKIKYALYLVNSRVI